MKKIYTIFSVLFFVLLACTTVLTVVIPDKEYSESENRNLTQKPNLSTKTIMDGKFQNTLDKYLSDQFPLRDFMMSLNTATNKLLGNDKVSGAYIGKNDYYFEAILDKDINYNDLQLKISILNRFATKYSNLNVNIILPPTSSDVYSEFLPKHCEIYNADLLYDTVTASLDNYIDIRSALKEKADEYIYYKTDHHWTSLGAYYAYVEYCNSNDIEPKAYKDFGFTEFTDEFYGSLHSKTLDWNATPDSVSIAKNIKVKNVYVELYDDNGATTKNEIDVYDYSKLENKDKYLVFFGDNYGKTVIETECTNGKTLLVVKDSFANSLVPLLTEHYEKIIMIDQRYYPKFLSETINNENITDVLFIYEITNLSIQTDLANINY